MKWDETGIPDLTGKVAVVTGGNAGLGLQTVKQLALHGANVYIGARSESRARQAIESILSENKSISKDQIRWLALDLSKLSSVLQAVQSLQSEQKRLDILINNAGIAAETFVTTDDGFELTMAVNHVGHFVLTTKLLPLLKATAATPGSDVRVVNVSSSGEKFAPKGNAFASTGDLNNPGSTSPNGPIATFNRYGASKLANLLFTRELQRKLDQDGVNITALTLDPGPVATEGGMGIFPFFLKPIMWLLMKSPAKGALTQLYCATAKDIVEKPEQYKGQFLTAPGKVGLGSERSRDKQLAQSLWRITEESLVKAGVDGYKG